MIKALLTPIILGLAVAIVIRMTMPRRAYQAGSITQGPLLRALRIAFHFAERAGEQQERG